MSKITYIVATIALIGAFAAIFNTMSSGATRQLSRDTEIEELWQTWKLQNEKFYATQEEEAHKFKTFTDNAAFVEAWNSNPK